MKRAKPTTARRLASVRDAADLVRYSYGLRHQDPRSYLDTAKVAVIASRTSPATVQAQAWSNMGNALRICGRLGPARRALEIADGFNPEGDCLARHLRFRASWHLARHDLAAAAETLREAAELYLRLGDPKGTATCNVKYAIVLAYRGEPAAAYEVIRRTLPAIGDDRDLLRAAWDIALFALIEEDRLADAFALLLVGQEVFYEGGEAYRLKIRWAEGLLSARMGSLSMLEGLRDEYASNGQVLEAAQVAIDIARFAALRGQQEEFSVNASYAGPILASLGVSVPSTAGQLDAARLLLRLQGFGFTQGAPSGSTQAPPS